MMATHRNVAAVMAVLLSTLLTGCPTTPMDPDADSGNNPMTDGGVPDGDSGPDPLDDGGMDGDSGSDPMICTPTQEDPLCEMAPPGADCECDLTGGLRCDLYPAACEETEYRNTCDPGLNRCGDDWPVAMEEGYDPTDFPSECEEYIDGDIWSDGSMTTIRSERRNGQLMVTIRGREFGCSFEGRCYYDWSYEVEPEDSPSDGRHGWFEITPDCQRITGEFYYGWHGQIEPDETFTLGFQEFGAT